MKDVIDTEAPEISPVTDLIVRTAPGRGVISLRTYTAEKTSGINVNKLQKRVQEPKAKW